jgi:hypothetical protein
MRVSGLVNCLTADLAAVWQFRVSLEHDPEKWVPVFGKDHAQTKS